MAVSAEGCDGDRLAVASADAASRASEEKPASSQSQPMASPCAAAIATRMPVKLPGPTADQDRGRPRVADQLGEHRHQPLGMAAADPLVGARR